MLKISVINRAAFCCSDKDPITTGSVGYPVEFLFSDDWNGLQKIAVFRGSGLAFDVPLINTDSTVIPHEVLTQAGKSLLIGVYGANGDGDVVIPTVYANAGIILPGTEPSEVDPSIPTPSWAIQVQEAAENTLRRAQESADAAASDAQDAAAAAQDAAASAVLAESWAVGDTGTRDGENQNNAKLWAQVAQQGAEQAEMSADSAANSAAAAGVYASDAHEDASNAAQSKEDAEQAKVDAAQSASTAASSAATATTKASEASASASAASGSASQAATSATNAGASATAAAASATAAAGSASTANTKAGEAASSATAAANAQTAAAASATAAAGSASTASTKAGEAASSATAAANAQTAAETAQGAAEDASEAIQNMQVSAETSPAGSQADVEKTVDPETGEVSLLFSIPKGDTGYPTDAQVSSAVDTWLGNNVAQETGYVLDRTLSLANAAAPSDLVGGIDVKVNGEVSRNYTVGKSLYGRTGNHTIEDDPDTCLSDLIPVTWGTAKVNFWYTNDTSDAARYQLWWYDENLNYLSYRARNPAPAFTRDATPPTGAAYCQFCFKRGFAGRLTENANNPVVIYYQAAETIVSPGLVQDVGDVSELNTDDKSSTVAAINEVNREKLESEILMRGTNLLYHLDSIAIGAAKNNMGTASAIYNTIIDKVPVSEGQTVLVSIDQIENEVQDACVTYIFKDSANENVKRSSFDKIQARNGVKLKVPTGAVKLSILLYPSISGGLTDVDAVYTGINVLLAEGQSPSINPFFSDTTYRVPPYYLENGYLEGKLNDIADCIEASGGEFDAFPFISDMHWLLNARNSPALIEFITKRFPMPRLFIGGDNDDGINVDLNNQIRRAYRGNVYIVNGNHEFMNSLVVDGVRDNTVTITGTSIWMYYHQQMTDCVVGNADRGYYYVDNTVQKMRYVILSAYTDGPTFQFEGTQKTWFATTLNSTPSGYTVVVFIHDIGSVDHSTGTLNQNRAYSDVCEVVDAYSGTVACILAGHTHFDAMGATPGGVPIIVTTCDKMGAYGDGEAWLTAQRIAGTITEQAFDVIIVDKTNRLVSAVRIGCPADNPAGSPLEKRTAHYT